MKKYNLDIEGEKFGVSVESVSGDNAVVTVNGRTFKVTIEQDNISQEDAFIAQSVQQSPTGKSTAGSAYKIKSPLPGLILGIKVKEGEVIKEGQVVAVLEAMKMENDIEAERGGIVKSVKVEKGDSVLEGSTLLVIE